MPVYTYRASDDNGRRVCGHRNVPGSDEVKQYLEKKGLTNYTIFLSKTVFPSRRLGLFPRGHVSAWEISLFCRQMAAVFFSRLTITEGVAAIAEQTGNVQLKAALTEICEIMGRDFTLSEAMSMYGHVFSNYMLNMINIGETSGTLDVVFAKLSDYYAKESETVKKVAAHVRYPLTVFFITAILVFSVSIAALPVFDSLLLRFNADMPGFAEALSGIARGISKYSVIVIISITAVIIGAFYYLRSQNGKPALDALTLKIPAVRAIYMSGVTARLARSLAMLLKSGTQLPSALDDLRPLLKNGIVAEKFREVAYRTKQDGKFSESIENAGIFPPLFVNMSAIGQKTGKLDELMDKMADILEKEAEESLNKLISVTEPALMFLLFIVVGAVLLSVIIPMAGVMGAIGL